MLKDFGFMLQREKQDGFFFMIMVHPGVDYRQRKNTR